jgi:hypothetical protein
MIYFLVAFGVFVLLQVGDIYTTKNSIDLGGTELNPIMKKFMDMIGVLPALVFSKLAIITIFLVLYVMLESVPTNIYWLAGALGFCDLVYIGVVYNNYKVMSR